VTAAVALNPDVCPLCALPRNKGLCSDERCRRAVLPQLAKPALVRLIGDSLTEQTKRQSKGLTPKERVKVAAIGRRNARRHARQKRGPFALLRAIARA
jgi:hypothetical protein